VAATAAFRRESGAMFGGEFSKVRLRFSGASSCGWDIY
jgi:hypothetical protein